MQLGGWMLCLHLIAVAIWVGGMAVMHFAVRPAAVAVLPPPLRLAFLSAVLGRFFNGVAGAILVLLLSGFAMWREMPFAGPGVHAMAGLGLLMTLIFVLIRVVLYPGMRTAVAAENWPGAARLLGFIRHLVALNLALGITTIALACLMR